MLLEDLNVEKLDAYDSPMPLAKWMETDMFRKLSAMEYDDMRKKYFNRDPERKIIKSEKAFLSPADGVILYRDEYKPDQEILEVKGKKYTLRKILEDKKFDKSAVVVGIFMTIYDVHLNRVPYAAEHRWKNLPPIHSKNLSLGTMEDKEIFHKHMRKHDLEKGGEYLFNNERVVSEFYIPERDYTYYVVQIADKEINAIEEFSKKQGQKYEQGEQFGRIGEGSQVDLILPLPLWGKHSFPVKNHWHVKAGMDDLVRID